MASISQPNQSVWTAGDLITFVTTGETTGNQFSLFDVYAPPNSGPPPHIHTNLNETFYILDGNLSVQLDDKAFTATPGTFVYIPEGHVHAFHDLDSTPTRFLTISTPSGLEKPFEAVGIPGTDKSNPPPENPNLLKGSGSEALGVKISDSLIFSQPQYTTTDDGTLVAPINVVRPGSAQGTASATLSAGTNKLPVKFADGQSLQTVDVPVTKDSVTNNKNIDLSLTNLSNNLTPALLQNKAIVNTGDSGDTSNSVSALYNLTKLQPNPQAQSFSLEGGTATVKITNQDTDGLYSLLDVSLPGQTGPEPYINHQEDQGIYVIDGNVSFQLDDQTFTAAPGTFVYAPKNDPYAFSNLGTTPARLLLLSSTPTAVPEPGFTWGLLPIVAWGVISQRKNKLKKQKLAHR